MSQWRLAGRTTVVTGGAGGMGAAIAKRLSGMGAKVAVLDRKEADAKQVAAEIDGMAVAVDLTDREATAEALGRVVAELGPIEILVNNAGWDQLGPFVDSDPAVWDTLIAINLRAPIQLTHLVLPSMIERGAGRLVFISSDAARVGSSGEAVYAACKGGLISFAKTIAREVARAGITSNVVCPGPSDTPLLREAAGDNPKLVAALERAIPVGRLGTPEDIAPAVAYLVTEEAAFITGQTLSVSGGLTMA